MQSALQDLWKINNLPGTCLTGDNVHRWDAGVLERLLELGFLRRLEPAQEVSCLSCNGEHWEKIITLPPGKDGKPRHFISCRENGRERVPEYRLHRYGLDLEGIARFLHRTMKFRGEPREIVPGQVWALGRLALAGKFRDVLLAHGLTWKNRSETVARCPQFAQTARPVVLVTGLLPYQGTLPPDVPTVALSQLIFVEDGQVQWDQDLLEQAADGTSRIPEPRSIKRIVLQPGTGWEQLSLRVGDRHLTFIEGDQRHRRSFEEAGFRHGGAREPRPDAIWNLLVKLAKQREINPGERGGSRSPNANLRVKAGELRERLRLLCNREDDPFQTFKELKVYKPKFPIEYGETAVIFLPSGTIWESLVLREVQETMLEVEVETTEMIGGYADFEEDDDAAAEFIAAVNPSTERQTYSFESLELLTNKGRLKPVGETLRLVLRSRGKPLQKLSPEKAVTLNRYLSDLFQIPEDAMVQDPQTKCWQCLFKAESVIAPLIK
jgi:hypothetical protein